MAAVTELATTAGIQAACQALALPRASFYRKLHPYSSASPVRRRSARALGPQEKETVLACLHEERFQDRSPAAVYATLLDEELSPQGNRQTQFATGSRTHCPISELRGNNRVEFRMKANSEVT